MSLISNIDEIKDFDKNKRITLSCDLCHKKYHGRYSAYIKRQENNKLDLCQNCINIRDDNSWKTIIKNYCLRHNYVLKTDIDSMVEINRETRIEYICGKHGVVNTSSRSVKDNRICPKCNIYMLGKEYRSSTYNERKDDLYSRCLQHAQEMGYELLTSYEDVKTFQDDILYKCPKHGIKRMRAGNFVNKRICMECANEQGSIRNRMDISEVCSRIEECKGKLLNPSDYINNSKRNLYITCPECKKPFKTSFVLFTQHGGQICKQCESGESLGEKLVRYYLQDNNINFKQEYCFSDCKDQRPLPFDFYLPEHNTIIEFDGSQHYVQTDYFTYDLATVKKHDAIKNNYCLSHGIKIIRIAYWQASNISKILNKELKTSHKDIV